MVSAMALVVAFGESMTAKAWSRDARCLVSERTLRVRLREGWPAEKAIGSPAQPKGRPAKVLVEGFGESKSIFGWSKDPRCEVSHAGKVKFVLE